MKYWKIEFDDKLEGFGWLRFDDNMNVLDILDEKGNAVKSNCCYTPIEFDTKPDWA